MPDGYLSFSPLPGAECRLSSGLMDGLAWLAG